MMEKIRKKVLHLLINDEFLPFFSFISDNSNPITKKGDRTDILMQKAQKIQTIEMKSFKVINILFFESV